MEPSKSVRNAAIVLGLGLGGFFDGIVFHQILQWHHMLTSAGFPPSTVSNLEVNTLWDGLFHAATYLLCVIGLVLLWRALRAGGGLGSARTMIGGFLFGWGLFNVLEGLVNHQILGIHHVRDDLPEASRLVWDMGFLGWGAVMILIGILIVRSAGNVRHASEAAVGHTTR
jgi:uncharacterized membrane protein